jgi:hypothetical protein
MATQKREAMTSRMSSISVRALWLGVWEAEPNRFRSDGDFRGTRIPHCPHNAARHCRRGVRETPRSAITPAHRLLSKAGLADRNARGDQ